MFAQGLGAPMQTEAIFILLLVLATSVAIATRRLRVPYTVALVVAGLVIGPLNLIEAPQLTREILFFVFLPGLLFEAAYHLDYGDFRRHLFPIGSLAIPGVVAAAGLTALVLTPAVTTLDLAQGFTWQLGLVFGAIIAATDPIAVVALLKSLGAPKELALIMEGESLLNDGTAIVLFGLILVVVSGGNVGAGELVLDFARIVGGGAVVGIAIGMAVSEVVKRVADPMIEITLTTIAAYGSFVAAERFGFSGVIAVVSAGMLCGNYAAAQGMTPSTRIAVDSFWQYVAFALNSLVFLLIGFEVRIGDLAAAWLPILVAYVAVLASRGAVTAAMTWLLRARGRHMPWSWSAVLWWGGLRGGLCMVLALSLAADFPNRDLLVTMTFGVVTLVILAHGFTMSPLLSALRLTSRHRAQEEFELTRGRLHLAERALEVIRGMERARTTDRGLLEDLEKEYEERVEREEKHLRELNAEHPDLRAGEISRTLRQVLLAERRQATESYRSGLLSPDVYEKLAADIDARLMEAEGRWTPAAERDDESAPVEPAQEEAAEPAHEVAPEGDRESNEAAPKPPRDEADLSGNEG